MTPKLATVGIVLAMALTILTAMTWAAEPVFPQLLLCEGDAARRASSRTRLLRMRRTRL